MHDALVSRSGYHKEIDQALGDDFLRRTLDTFAVAYRANRAAVFKEVDEKGLIKKVADAKDYACQHMEELYAKFKAEAEKRGVHVHRAKDAADANRIIAEIGKQNKVKRIVKSKSMTAEEIHLKTALEKEGFIVDETDLGEWIIQLRHEGPSHMVMPAIHLSRYQVADDFTKVTGEKQDTDIQRLVKVARVQLRRKFIAADMGVSGCNFAIAENGAVSTVTNEGNARMVTTVPRVHVVLAGLDKLITKIEEVLDAVQVLPRNATAQRLTSYFTLMCGAGQCNAEGSDNGRKIMHVVFLDNGRTQIAKDPLFKQIFRCVRCGACANVCPVFRLVGGHKMGYVYIGSIGLILTYFFHGHDRARILVQNCIGCESCANVCSGGIELPRLTREIRSRLNAEEGNPIEGTLMSAVMKNRKMFHSLMKFASFSTKPFAGGSGNARFMRHLPMAVLGKHGYKALPALAPKPFRDKWAEIMPRVQNPKLRVALFAGCAQDFIYPEELEAAVKVLAAKDVAVDFPMEQTCCGLPLEMMGQRKTSIDVANQNMNAFRGGNYDYIVTLCASCASHLKHGYAEILDGTTSMLQAQAFGAKVIDFSSFVHDVLGLKPEDFNKSDQKVTYHASCHLCRKLNVHDAPRELIADAAEYVPCEEEEVCCGFGGTYSAKFPEISAQILNKKLDHVQATGASRLVVDCPGCVMQLRGGAEKRGMHVKVDHIAELLAENIKK
ncbi:MAG: LUD domain-containing protein [Desulfovibrio sp.]|nr:LUD domain-containing protein [Desulfovibrio sp.]